MLIAFKLKIALACAAGLATPLTLAPLISELPARPSAPASAQAMVEILPASAAYRVAGDFTRHGRPAEAPQVTLRFERKLSIMQHQVSAADYRACVDDGGCRALERAVVVAPDRPAVQVSWHDANAYAAWLSRRTGETYRLPTDEEWAFAAGSKFRDDGLAVDDNDPAKRWIAKYERESDRDAEDTEAHRFGRFGVNEHGLSDLAGNVWEWTSTCFVRGALDDSGHVTATNSNCGVRVAEGAHRAYVTDFIRDARAGGCAAGVPPSNLGFRLVREPASLLSGLSSRLSRAFARS
jgi:formylglycine-generating enzyme required for sulfatase activity